MRKTCVKTVEIQWLACAPEHNLCTPIMHHTSYSHAGSRKRAQHTTLLPTSFPQQLNPSIPLLVTYFSALSTGPITTTTNIFINS